MILQPVVYPLTLSVVVAVSWVAIAAGAPLPVVTASAAGAVMLWLVVLERTIPFSRAWRDPKGDRLTDVLHFSVSAMLMDVVTHGLIVWGAVALSRAGILRLWPADLPLALQVVLALALAELGGYASHVAMHRVPFLWRFHAIHHSAERLYFVNAFRNHPGDIVFSTAATIGPLAVLGVPENTLAMFTVFSVAHLLFQHSNVDYRVGPLRYVLSVGEAHRWHHSRKLDEAEANYGNVLLIWDLLFRTWRIPRHRPPDEVGLAVGRTMQPGYLAHLASPFLAPPDEGLSAGVHARQSR